MLNGFIRPEALKHLAAEAEGLSAKAYFCKSTHNAYLTEEDGLDGDDVRARQEDTYVGSVAYDLIPPSAALRRLYTWDPLRDFIGAVLGKPKLHRFADALGACSINVFTDGGEHGWHFDESEFTVTLMLQPPEVGGAFEYVPKIRGLANEQEIVGRVLDGDRAGVVELPFTPGTLLIFGGNQTIHRVARVSGPTKRLVPVLCYAEEAGLTLLPESTLDLEVREGAGLVTRRFRGEEPERVVGLAWRRGSPRAEEYRQLGEEIVQLFDAASA